MDVDDIRPWIDYCAECRGFRNLPLMDPLACTCDADILQQTPPDPGPDPYGEPVITTVNLPGDRDA